MIAHAAPHEVGGLLENVVADTVAEAIVVVLEIVDIEEEEEGHREAVLACFAENAGQEMLEVPAVEQTRQIVREREPLQSGLSSLNRRRLGQQGGDLR